MLLLFAVRMVRTGIERCFGASFQQFLTQHQNFCSSSITGVGLALMLQSSASVALLVSGFAATRALTFTAGLATVLGGDLGSALVIQILSFQLDWLIPLLLTLGGWFFVKTEKRRTRQYGRLIMGVAFILIALRFLREAIEPIRDSSFLPAITDYLTTDYLSAFLVGMALTFIMHSSVAMVLMCVTLVSIDAIPLPAGISLVLGANLGSALIPMWLTRGMDTCARRIPLANLLLRGGWALIALFLLNLTNLNSHLQMGGPGQTLVNTHIAFNIGVIFLSLPLYNLAARITNYLIPETTSALSNQTDGSPKTALDYAALNHPQLSLANLKRELLRMSEVVECMARPIMALYESGNRDEINQLRAMDKRVNSALTEIKKYVAAMPLDKMEKAEAKRAHDMAEYAISLEIAGDIVAKRLLPLVEEKTDKVLNFSKAGWSELQSMHRCMMANMGLASNVLVSDDLESARLLVKEKTDITHAERDSRKRHLKRLSEGGAVSFESSDIHLETLRALRDLNSQISAVAYPILYRAGQLLETRLIENMDKSHS